MPAREAGVHAAERYDSWFDGQWGAYAFNVERTLLLHVLGLVEGRAILDAGCGTGRFTRHLQERRANVVGLDVDEGVLAVARRRVSAPLILGDGQALPFADAVFDAAVAVTLCEFAGNPAQVVSELARVVRRGGRIVVGALNRRSPWGIAHRRRFERAPWAGAHFFSWDELLALGEPHGTTRIETALFAPASVPGLAVVGPALELLGALTPRAYAFRALVIDKSAG